MSLYRHNIGQSETLSFIFYFHWMAATMYYKHKYNKVPRYETVFHGSCRCKAVIILIRIGTRYDCSDAVCY